MISRFLICSLLLVSVPLLSWAQEEEEREFSTNIVDLGVVVSDIDKAVKFYTEAIGFKEAGGFTVPADFARDAGLTAGKELKIRVLKLGDGENATSLKLMQVGDTPSRQADNHYIDSELGFSYITLHINSTDKAMERLKKAGVKPIKRGPVTLPGNLNPDLSLTIVRDPDGNFVELVGPKPTQ